MSKYVSTYYSRNPDKRRAWHREYYHKHREKNIARARRYYANNKEKSSESRKKYYIAHKSEMSKWHKQYHLKKSYNITVEEYEKIMSSNNGMCMICNFEPSNQIDHNHENGKIRGALCGNCNRMLGIAKDNINILSNAILYLKLHEKEL